MKKHLRWLGACTALLLAVFVVSCDDGPTTVPDQTTTAAPETAAPSMDMVSLASVWGDCLNEVPGTTSTTRFNNPTCSANDVEIKVLEALSVDFGAGPVPIPPGGTVTCVEGTTFDVQLRAYFGFNRSETYDIAYFLAEDGGDALTGDCFHGFLEPIASNGGAGTPTAGPPYEGPYRDAEESTDPNDVCGDARESDETTVEGITGIGAIKRVPQSITVTCEDDDDDGFVEIGTCTSWDINASNGGNKPTCEGVDDAFPGTPAKCNCGPAPLPINVQRQATVKVIKDLSPDDDAGTFDLAIFDYDDAMVDSVVAASDGGFAGPYTLTWFQDDEPEQNQASVQEYGANLGSLDETTTPSAFDFYTTTYNCVENNNSNGPVSGSGKGPVDLTLENGDDWVCTFTNTRIPVPAVAVSKDTVPTFTRKWTWTIDKKGYDALDTELTTDTTLALQKEEVFNVGYKVTVTPTSKDTLWHITGTITISVSDTSGAAALDPFGPYVGTFSVVDTLVNGGTKVAATVDCDAVTGGNQTTISNVNATGDYTCSYDSGELSMGGTWVNTATADISWNSGSQDDETKTGSSTHDFTGQTPTTETDETVAVCDDKGSAPVSSPCTSGSGDYLGSWTGTTAKDFEYDNPTPACSPPGSNRLNTARFTTNDTAATDTAQFRIFWTCFEPPEGCTLTQGYWKTHSEFGPAPYDAGWEVVTGASVCSDPAGSPNDPGVGADVEFFDGGECYYDIFWDPGKGGNFFMKLAHQYMAAWLNVEAGGSDPSCVSDELADAASLLEYYADPPSGKDNSIPKQGTDWCDTQPGGSACESYNSDRQYAVHLNNVLTMYNEGDLACADHCDDDGLSVLYGTPD